MYVRLFDSARKEEKLRPLGVVRWESTIPAAIEVVPCVYLTNRAMAFLPDTACASLAMHVFEKVRLLAGKLDNPIREIQMDCDWSEETREKYFAFLLALKEKCRIDGWQLSATIRLHQIKYREKTGVPPVDYGMLMFYNMGEMSSPSEENSILNLNTAEKYLGRLEEYPLELDLALPIFSWAVQFRNNQMEKLHSA